MLKERVNTYPALLYKFAKINAKISEIDSVSLLELKSLYPEIDEISETVSSIKSLKITEPDNLSVLDYMKIFRAFKKAKDEVEIFNEDLLPSYTEIKEPQDNFTEAEVKQQKVGEHIVFAFFGLIIRDLGIGPVFYELSMVDPEEIPDGEFKATFLLLRNFMLYEKGLYYLSEHELTQNIDWIKDNPGVNFNTSLNVFGLINAELNQQMRSRVLIFNHLLRGLDRLKMDDEASEELAMRDFEAIINIAKESGIDNEIIQAIEVYFHLKNKNPEKAIIALNRLKESQILSNSEKESIDKTIDYLKNRETDKVFNGVYDKLFLSKVIGGYIYAQAKEVDWKKVLKDNDIEIPKVIEDNTKRLNDLIQNINKYTSEMDIEETQEKLKERGLDLWKKSKSLLD